jgi:hypothetical protein
MLENEYQSHVIQKLRDTFPGCFVVKIVPPPQGIPDLLIECGKTWARLETKKSLKEPYQPNQEFYIDMFDKMGFCKMICPENEEVVLRQLSVHFTIYSGLFVE